jgi:hypothetical protein
MNGLRKEQGSAKSQLSRKDVVLSILQIVALALHYIFSSGNYTL